MRKILRSHPQHCNIPATVKSVFLLLSVIFIMVTVPCHGQGVGINPTGNQADTSAGLDVDFTNKGILIPRMSIAQRNAIYQPANGLLIYNTDCNTFNYNAGTPSVPNWVSLLSTNILPAPGAIAGLNSVCSNQQGVAYSIPAVVGATTYTWTVPSGASIVSGQGTTSISVDFGNNYGNICVTAGNNCGSSSASCISVSFNASPLITASPINSTLCAGANTTFSVTATGSGLTYQWQEYNGSWNNLSNTPPYSNVTTSTMNITNAATSMDTYQYRCIVSGICPPTPVTSNAATLNVYAVPSSAFSWSPINPNTLQATTFTPATSGAIYSWTFASGSPSTSTAQNPAVTWSATGTYNVTLAVTQNGCSSTVTTNPVTVIYCPHSSQTFTYTGSAQTWTVPSCITSITVDALGAGGGITPGSGVTAGSGGRITATIPVTSGQVLTIIAGGVGQDGQYNRSGSGGGGFSGVLDNSGNHLVSAGGGGGSAGNEGCPSVGSGGNGGGNAGTSGSCGSGGAAGITNTSPTGGAGGTASNPGSPGTSSGGGNGGATTGDSGTGGGGGGYGTAGGTSMYGSCGGNSGAGGFGGGGSGGTGGCGGTQERLSGGGGGGGGFNGGAGGNVTIGCSSCGGGGGGGGRNYAIPGATVTTNSIGGGAGMQTSGSVTITW